MYEYLKIGDRDLFNFEYNQEKNLFSNEFIEFPEYFENNYAIFF